MKKLVITLLLFISANSYADDFQSGRRHTHDGFFFRALVGVGSGNTTFDDPSIGKYDFSGASSSVIFQVGGAITENLVVYYEGSSHAMMNPDVEHNGSTVTTTDLTTSTVTSGIGLSYYIIPSNIYFSGSIALAYANIETQTSSGSSDLGFGTNIMLGKEWWVSSNWGIGVAAFYHYSKMKDKSDSTNNPGDIINSYGGIAFTATYN